MTLVSDLRDQIELIQSSEYARFLLLVIPAFSRILEKTPVSYHGHSLEHVIEYFVIFQTEV